jgi:DNA-binding CsgD family transcriptional regulator
MVDTDNQVELNPRLLCHLYGLAPREAELVVQLVRGATLREAAARLGIREVSARTYLKEIFSKTSTHRQAELVSLVLTGVASLIGG